ncbi:MULTISPECIES: Rnf-Nqr domain containing protein [Pseudomonas]|uniref:Rnf-Nqr domain containing protein n=1 Tax=Pseudomonas TaxID=286 RepID=UPI001BE4F363|nr:MULTISPECIES: Rnf-Nqr domain containing protein [Pseudomonas]MBT2340402.1 NADH:quinone oxidoreductase [Pseudomonas fluorescens]MCD4528624.1 NADH:quinone oxidoreductase [Pseudomonas sp. C3-2018]
MTEFVLTLLSTALINNLVLHWPLGVDPLLDTHGRRQVHALGLATTCLMLTVGTLGYLIDHWLLAPTHLTSLRLLVWLPLSALLIGPLLRVLARWLPTVPFDGLWPLLLGNVGVLGITLLNGEDDQGLGHAIALSLGGGLGFWLVLSLFEDLRQRTFNHAIAMPFRGLPIQLISAGLMAVAFLGLRGLVKT